MKNKNPIKVSALFKGKPDINLNNSEIGNDFYDVSKDVRAFSSPSTPYEAKRKGLSYIMGISESDTQHMSEQHIKIASLKDIYDYLNVLDTHPKTKGADAYYIETDMGKIVLDKGDKARTAIKTIFEELERKELPENSTNFMLSAFFSKRVDQYVSGKQLRLAHLVYDLNKQGLGRVGYNMIIAPKRAMKTKTFVPSPNRYAINYDHHALRKNEPLFWTCVPTKVEHSFYSLRDVEKRLKNDSAKSMNLTSFDVADLMGVLRRGNHFSDPQTKFVDSNPTYCPAPSAYPVIDLKEVGIATLNCSEKGVGLDLPFFDEHKQITLKAASNAIKKMEKSKEKTGLESKLDR